jgi:hypothetical protein
VTFLGAVLGLGGREWRVEVTEQHRRTIDRARSNLLAAVQARTHGASDVRASRSARVFRSADEAVVVVWDGEVPDTAARRWLQAAERGLRAVPRGRAAGVPVIIALHTRNPAPRGGEELAPPSTSVRRYHFANDGSDACIVDVTLPRKGDRERGRFDVPPWLRVNLPGRCALYARYGVPGAAVANWGGLRGRWTEGWTWWYEPELSFIPQHVPRDTLRFRPVWGTVPWAELACFRGLDAYCEGLVGLATVPGVELGGSYYYYYYGWWSLPRSDRIMADLLRERGPERFASFWASPLTPDSALRLAYGVPAATLAREAFAQRFVPEPTAQPGVPRLLVAFGWVLALGALAMGLAWRREMDL